MPRNMMPQDWGRSPVYLGAVNYLPNFGGDGGGFFGARPPMARPGGFGGGYGSALRNTVAPQKGVAPIGMPTNPAVTGPLSPIGGIEGGVEGGGLGEALRGIAGGVGGAIGKGVGWLTDEKKGLLRQMLLSNLIGTAGSIYEAHKVGEQEDEDRKRRDRSRASVEPMFGKLLAELSQQR